MPNCSARVLSPGMFRDIACAREATIEVDGRWFCFQHNPVRMAIKQEEQRQRWKEKDEIRTRAMRREKQDRKIAALARETVAAGGNDWSAVMAAVLEAIGDD